MIDMNQMNDAVPHGKHPAAIDKALTRIDLNLLRALHVLLQERSVTRSADRLFISQPAMSKALQRLRELLDDQLFVRSPHGLLPTTRATELIVPLQTIFEQVETCLTPSLFDPANMHGCVRIATPEQFALLTIPQTLLRLRAVAPGLSLESQHLMDDHLEKLATGSLDFVINLEQPHSDDFIATRIYSASPMLWFRRGHPLADRQVITVEDMCAYPQITLRTQNVTPYGLRAIEQTFAEAGLHRDVCLDTSHLLIALDVLLKTDALMPAPDYLSRLSIVRDEIVPRSINHITTFDSLRINLSLLQHKRTANSPLHQWVIGEISSALLAETAVET